MSQFASILAKPEGLSDESAFGWFRDIADYLLNRTKIVVGGQAHRLTEIEFYYFDEDIHPDYFAHRDPLQLAFGRWYFHRMDGTYKGGSFKGLDISFGDGEAFGGVLLRGLEKEDGTLIDGPCLCVDHFLAAAGQPKVATLDEAIDERSVWDEESPMVLLDTDEYEARDLWSCSRVGLTLKRAFPGSNMPYYITRMYRFLTEPRKIKKGKANLVPSLLQQGYSPEEINKITGTPRKSIESRQTAYEEGLALDGYEGFIRKTLTSDDLARLHGACVSNPLSNEDA